MVATAKFLGMHIKNKTVVLTGSMVLPSEDEAKDALASLSFALTQVRGLPVGVYIAMQGTTFRWDNVRKNAKKGRFEMER